MTVKNYLLAVKRAARPVVSEGWQDDVLCAIQALGLSYQVVRRTPKRMQVLMGGETATKVEEMFGSTLYVEPVVTRHPS